jgi:Domain of unknown function (DUF4411)
MAGPTLTHVLDTNVFVQAHRAYYPFDVCPGFWDCLEFHGLSSRIVSIDRVLKEIKDGNDELKTWASKHSLRRFFAPTGEEVVVARYREIVRWVEGNAQFTREAKSEFADEPDGWVIAFAKAHGLTVATLEVSEPNSKKRVKIPDVCIEFGILYENTFDLLRSLGARFVWTPPV